MFNSNYDEIVVDNYDLEKELSSKKKDEFLGDKKGEQDNWFKEDYEGELTVDVYQTEKEIIIKSTIAGIKPEDIDISINNDMITIRGTRKQEHEIDGDDYFFQECYWGGFSRSIILPQSVKTDKIQASLENGILTVILPKAPVVEKVTVKVTRTKPVKKEKIKNVKEVK